MKKVILLCTLALMSAGAIQGMERKVAPFGLQSIAKASGALKGSTLCGENICIMNDQGYAYAIKRSTPEQEQKDIAEMEKLIEKQVAENKLKLEEQQKRLQNK